MGGLFILLVILFSPLIIMAVGFAQLLSSKPEKKKQGKKLMLIGAIAFAVEILIGFAICSNMSMNFH